MNRIITTAAVMLVTAVHVKGQVNNTSGLQFDIDAPATEQRQDLRTQEAHQPTLTCSVPRVAAYFRATHCTGGKLYVAIDIVPKINSTLMRTGTVTYKETAFSDNQRTSASGGGGRRGVDASSRYVNSSDSYTISIVINNPPANRRIDEVSVEATNQYGCGYVTLKNVTW